MNTDKHQQQTPSSSRPRPVRVRGPHVVMLSLELLMVVVAACSLPNPGYLGSSSEVSGAAEAPDETDDGEAGESNAEGETDAMSTDPNDPPADLGGQDPGDTSDSGSGSGSTDSGAGTDSGASSSSGTDTGAPPDEELVCDELSINLPQECAECLELSCCAELSECASDTDCQCVFDCMAQDGLALLCQVECGLDELDELPVLAADLLTCLDGDCSESCPALAGL